MTTAALIIIAWTSGMPFWASLATTILAALHLATSCLTIRIKKD